MAQVVYYFAAALQLGGPERRVAFSVPTGNFGDVFAGHVAARMGLPIEELVVATNVNDILHRALSDGTIRRRGDTHRQPQHGHPGQPNFERLLFDVGGRDGVALAEQMRGFDVTRAMRLTEAQSKARSIFHQRARRCVRHGERDGLGLTPLRQILDPHTAIGLHAARHADLPPQVPVVTLATAHPAKFRDAVERATGIRPALPNRVGDLFAREEAYTELPGTYEAVRDHILEHAA